MKKRKNLIGKEIKTCVKREEGIEEKILEIYHDSHQNYGAPKITECLKKDGEAGRMK